MGTSTLGKIVRSRTVWGIFGLGMIPVLQAISPMIPAGTKTGAILGLILALYTCYCRIRAKQALGPVIDETIAKAVEAVHIIGATSDLPSGKELTTIASPQTTAGKVMQIAEVKAIVKATQ